MIQNVSSSTAVAVATSSTTTTNQPAAAAQQGTVTKKAVPSISQLDAQAWMLRQQVGAALYDRSFTLKEGERALKRLEAIEAYANDIFSKEGGPTARDLRRLANKLNSADKLLDRLSNNNKGVNLSSVEGIDGRDMDVVQANLADRIRAGLADGSLTEDEAKVLTEQQDQLAELEAKFRESDGKLTAGEMKQVMDQLRKSADAINQARNNGSGVNLGTYSYANSVDDRQAALEKMLAEGLKAGSLTEAEADQVRKQFEVVNQQEAAALKNGNVDWREWTNLSTSMNDAEILLYDLQRNTDGVKLADTYVDVINVDKRQAQQLEGLTRGIDNGSLTNDEAINLLDIQQDIQASENRLVRDGLTRSEYLRLQNQMNDYSLVAADLAGNKDRYDGLTPRVTLPPITGTPSTPPAPVAPPAPPATGGPVTPPTPPAPPAPPVAVDPVTPPAPPAPPAPPVAVDPVMPPAPPAPPVAEEPKAAEPPKAAAETKPAEQPKAADEAKKDEVASQTKTDEAGALAEYEAAMRHAARSYGEIKDRFAEFMTKAMTDVEGRVRDRNSEHLDKLAERRREEADRYEKADDDRKETAKRDNKDDDRKIEFGFGNRNADTEAKVGAYAAAAAKPAIVSLQKKVA